MHTVRNRMAVHNRAKPQARMDQGGSAPPGMPRLAIPAPSTFMFGGGSSSADPHALPGFPADVAIPGSSGVPIVSIPWPEELAAADAVDEEGKTSEPKPARKRKAAAKPGGKARKRKAKPKLKAKPRARTKTKVAKGGQTSTRSRKAPASDQPPVLLAHASNAANAVEVKFAAAELPEFAKLTALEPVAFQAAEPVIVEEHANAEAPTSVEEPAFVALAAPLPQEAEGLTAPAVATEEVRCEAPLPRSVALAPYRKGGLLDLIGFWLRDASRRATARLLQGTGGKQESRRKRAWLPTRRRSTPSSDDFAALRAENERLRQQLEALLALQEGRTPQTSNSPAEM